MLLDCLREPCVFDNWLAQIRPPCQSSKGPEGGGSIGIIVDGGQLQGERLSLIWTGGGSARAFVIL